MNNIDPQYLIQSHEIISFIQWIQIQCESGEMDMYELIALSPEYLIQRYKNSKIK